ncbi:peptidase M4 family protein [Pseudonocardiaceae bacterium YIM PH 21723]|nr:peptidase M4 family protein [Pseudonocardiaceae bacterium YIM PH 21723]
MAHRDRHGEGGLMTGHSIDGKTGMRTIAWSRRFGTGLALAITGTLAGLGATWLGLLLAGGGSGFDASIARQLRHSVHGVFTAFGAGMGAPVDWRSDAIGWSGRIWPVDLLGQGSPLLWVLAGPVVAALVTALLVRRHKPGGVGVLGIGCGYLLTLGAGPVLVAAAPGLLELSTPWPLRAGFAAGWVALAAALVLLGRIGLGRAGVPRLPLRPIALALTGVLAAGLLVASVGGRTGGDYATAATAAVDTLRREKGAGFLGAQESRYDVPSLLRIDGPLGAGPGQWLGEHAALFGLPDPQRQLREVGRDTDRLGQQHIRYQQTVDGIPVHDAVAIMHLDEGGSRVHAISSGTRPDLAPVSTVPDIDANAALATARKALPHGEPVMPVTLQVRGDLPERGKKADTRLVWRVWLSDPATQASNDYYVDAHTGHLRWLDLKKEAGRDIRVFDDEHKGDETNEAPDPKPVWSGGHHVGADVLDADKAYDWSGAAYDYYRDKFGRDGVDGKGQPVTAHAQHGAGMVNAFFDSGTAALYIGDNMASADVLGHELTHAVVHHTANLEYYEQPGALNESYADIFGKMSQRYAAGTAVTTDWTIGRGTAAGVIRDMADPHNGTDGNDPNVPWQPATMDEYIFTCMDNLGVHYNSGIANHAYYLMAQAIGEDRAEQIAYRTLTTYLTPTSGFNTAAQATIQAARDLYGEDTPEVLAAQKSWEEVGVIGGFIRYKLVACLCIIPIVVPAGDWDDLAPGGPGADEMLAASAHLWERMQSGSSPALSHYGSVIMDRGHDLMDIFNHDRGLRDQLLRTLQSLYGAMLSSGTKDGDKTVVSRQMIDETNALFDGLSAYGQKTKQQDIVDSVAKERKDVTPDLVGKTVNEATKILDKKVK